jgi:lipid II:glycine glycyltransferase (peptidoglycan interpeptide bridge formation enzyme)
LLVEPDRLCLEVLESEGFSRFGSRPARRSLIMDLTPDLDEIRKRLDKKWRNCLSKAERSDLEIVSGTEPDLFDEFLPVYQSMLRRKQLKPEADLRVHRDVQHRLPEHLKMRVVLARHGGRACAGAIYSPIGDTAIYLFGATDGAGMQTCASYAVQWTIVGELKGRNIQAYDLNGTNAELNPGTYHFKKGLAGRFTEEVTFAPQVQMHRATMANRVILGIDRMRARVRSTRPPAAARRIGETSTEPAVNR